MFPIIQLTSQLEAVNQQILFRRMMKQEIIVWLDYFGKLVRPDEEHELRYLPPLLGLRIEATNKVNAYIYRSNFGFLTILKFEPVSFKICINKSMSDFWDESGA